MSNVRGAWARVQRFPRAAWEAVVTPAWGETERGFFVDTVEGLREFLVAVVLERMNLLRTAKVARLALAQFGLDEKHRSAIERWVRAIREQYKTEILIATNPDRAKSTLLPAHGSMSAGVHNFLDLVELDGSPTIETRSGRRQLVIMTGVFSRAKVAILADSESTDATARLFVKFHDLFGLMRKIRTDRGAGFTSVRMRTFLERMNIALDIVPPFLGELKPFAESAVRITQQFFEYEKGFVGHNVSERTQLRNRLSISERRGKSEHEIIQIELSDREFEAHLDKFFALEAERPRDELGGKSTNQKIAEWRAAGGAVHRVEDAQSLFALLAPAGRGTVTEKELRVEGETYIAPKLGGIVGHRVEYRKHADASKLLIYTATRNARFICVAQNAEALEDSERRSEAIAARTEYRLVPRRIREGARKLIRRVGNPAELLLSAEARDGECTFVADPVLDARAHRSAKRRERSGWKTRRVERISERERK